MKRNITIMMAAGYALAALTSVAVAAPKAKAKTAATLTCPSCGMAMPTRKTAKMTVPVKVGQKTYFCCPECPSGKKAAAAAAHAKKA